MHVTLSAPEQTCGAIWRRWNLRIIPLCSVDRPSCHQQLRVRTSASLPKKGTTRKQLLNATEPNKSVRTIRRALNMSVNMKWGHLKSCPKLEPSHAKRSCSGLNCLAPKKFTSGSALCLPMSRASSWMDLTVRRLLGQQESFSKRQRGSDGIIVWAGI